MATRSRESAGGAHSHTSAEARFDDHPSPTPGPGTAVTPQGGVPLDEAPMTRRRRLQALLATREEGFPLDDLQQIFGVARHRLIRDLRHLQLSLRHEDAVLLMVPPSCDACGYVFHVEEPKDPGRCPSCKSENLHDPVFKVESAES